MPRGARPRRTRRPPRRRATKRASGRQRAEIVPYIEAAQIFTHGARARRRHGHLHRARRGRRRRASRPQQRRLGLAALRAAHRLRRQLGRRRHDQRRRARRDRRWRKGVTLEAGALAAQTRVEGNGAASVGGFAGDDDAHQPGLFRLCRARRCTPWPATSRSRAITASATPRSKRPTRSCSRPARTPVDVFDESTTHTAAARAGRAPEHRGAGRRRRRRRLDRAEHLQPRPARPRPPRARRRDRAGQRQPRGGRRGRLRGRRGLEPRRACAMAPATRSSGPTAASSPTRARRARSPTRPTA